MFLSDLSNKIIYASNQPRGVCLGVGISLKTYAVKYLLCSSSATTQTVDFAVSVSAVDEVGDGVNLKRLRAVFPNGCARIFIGRPIYSAEGGFIGFIRDVEMHDFAVTRLFSDREEIFSVTAIAACADAVILRKEQSFPIGQRVPAPLLSSKNEPIVTKSVLRKAIAKGELIKLTLALSPFRLELC